MKTHETEETCTKPYQCDICDKKFRHPNILRNGADCKFNRFPEFGTLVKPFERDHMNTHTGEKPYRCDKCDFACAAKANLHSHKKIHAKIPDSFEMPLGDESISDLIELEFSE